MAEEPQRNPISTIDVLGENKNADSHAFMVHQEILSSLCKLGLDVTGKGTIDLGNGVIGFTMVKLAASMEHISRMMEKFKEVDDVDTAIALARAVAYLSNSMSKATEQFRMINSITKPDGNDRRRSFTPGTIVTVEATPTPTPT